MSAEAVTVLLLLLLLLWLLLLLLLLLWCFPDVGCIVAGVVSANMWSMLCPDVGLTSAAAIVKNELVANFEVKI